MRYIIKGNLCCYKCLINCLCDIRNIAILSYFKHNAYSCRMESTFLTRYDPSWRFLSMSSASLRVMLPWYQLLKRKYYYIFIAKHINNWINCQQSCQNRRKIEKRLTHVSLKTNSDQFLCNHLMGMDYLWQTSTFLQLDWKNRLTMENQVLQTKASSLASGVLCLVWN